MHDIKVLVIIINFKTSHLIQGLINSIVENKNKISILIVDNASTQKTYNELKVINDDRIHILRSEKNLGFTGGINYALKYAMNNLQEFKYFFLINPDAFSSPNLISDLSEILTLKKDAACISPQILNLNGNPWYSGARINYIKGKVSTSISIESKNTDKYFEVDAFCGCAVLFDWDKVIEAGMFNEDLFMYYDEADLSIRLKEKGYKILYTPTHYILHDISYNTKNISYLKTYYMTRNKFIVFNKKMSLYNKIYFMLHEFAYHMKNWRGKNAIYHLRGFYDFVKGKKGQYKASSS